MTQESTPTRVREILAKALSLVEAVFTSKRVSPEIFAERVMTCLDCKYRKNNRCSICGCQVLTRKSKIINLAAFEERLPKWGCKHPERPAKGWKR